MNWDVIKGNAKQLSGVVKQKWGKLTDDDVKLLGGKSEEFFGRLQERMGIARDVAERELDEMLKKISPQRGNQNPS